MTKVRVGLALPTHSDVIEFSERAERLGFDYLAAPEHVAFHAPVPHSLVWLSVAAGATRSIGLVSTVSLLPLYPPVLFAKLVASLDYLSAGRLSVGVGVGGEYPEEFRSVGVPLNERGARVDESLEILNAILADDEPVSFRGRWTNFDQISIGPKLTSHRPPIWIGGRQKPAMRRAARFGDVWMPYMVTPEEVALGHTTVQGLAYEFMRERPIGTAVYLFAIVSDDEIEARNQAIGFAAQRYKQDFSRLSHKFLFGSPKNLGSRMAEYIDAGADTFILELVCDPADYRRQSELLARDVVPQLAGMEGR